LQALDADAHSDMPLQALTPEHLICALLAAMSSVAARDAAPHYGNKILRRPG
jgi:hypothetical protein